MYLISMPSFTRFSDFAALCESLRATSKRLEKVSLLSEFLKSLHERELSPAVFFLLGKAFPDHDSRTLNVSWRTVQRVMAIVEKAAKDLQPLTLLDIEEIFSRIATTSGQGSRKQIEALLLEMFNRASELERKYLVKIIFGEMQIGVAEGLVLEGIAKASDVKLELVRRANMYLGNPGKVATIALREGAGGLQKIELQLFRPVQPMLAELAEDFPWKKSLF